MRKELKNRRYSVTEKVEHTWASGKVQNMLVTFGFNDQGEVKEMFCADFKAGTDFHVMIMDACVAISLLLQHGHSIKDINAKFAAPPRSVLGTLVEAGMTVEKP